MEITFYDIFIFITIFLFVFFSFFLLSLKTGNTLSNKLFAVFLFSKAVCFSNYMFFRFEPFFVSISPHMFFIGESFEFLLGPAIFLYTLSLAYRDFKLRAYHLLHLTPFFVHLGFMSYKFHFFASDIKIRLLEGYALNYWESVVNYSAIYLHILIYCAAALYVLSAYRAELKKIFSSIENMKLRWLSMIIIGFIVLWATAALDFTGEISGYDFFNLDEVSTVFLFIFANLIIYMGLKQPKIFSGIRIGNNNHEFSLNESQRNRYLEKLNSMMKSQKFYLNPTLTLNELAEKVSVPPRYLSYVINKSFGQNYYDFINTYRIEESKLLLIKNKRENRTVLEILYQAGFNSKSVFNAAFKKHTGMTPSQFMKSHS